MEDYTIELPSHEELEAVTGRIREADCAWSDDGVWAVQDPSDIWIRLVVA